jgi:hypothetical protein
MSSPDWRLQPLRGFWQGVNWENRAIAKPSINSANNHGIAPVLSFLMPVREYFRAISWTGIPEIAATTVAEAKLNSHSNSEDEKRETLEDFLDDISNFF